MSVNTNNYNYVAGYFNCSNVGSKYTPFGTTYASNAAWAVEFESVKLSGAGKLAEHVDSDSDGWRVGIDSSRHPYVYWSRNSSYRGTYTFSSLTVSWDTWFYIKFHIQTNAASPVIRCTLNSMTQDVTVSGRWNNNYNRDLQVGDTTTTIRGTTTVSGYPYGSDTLTTATFNLDNMSVGATSVTVNGNSFTISSAIQNYKTTYTVGYNANGGSGTVASQTKIYGTNLTLRSGGYTKTGYTLTKWNTASGGTGTDYALSGTYSSNAAATMYAQWSPISYSVKFNANGGSGTMANESFTYDVAKALTSNAFTRSGYTFAGWATSATGSVVYSNGQSVSNLSSTNGAVVNLYAKWTQNTYTVSFNGNGGSGTVNSMTKYGGTALTLPTGGYTITGQHMTAWTLNSTSGVSYALGGSYTTEANATFYAKWAYNTYQVKFNAEGGTGTMANESFTYGTAKNLTANAFTKSGYAFLGWATTSGGTVAYTDGQSVSNLTATDNGVVNLYAVWGAAAGVKVKVNGEWKDGMVYAKVNGEWKEGQVFAKYNGTWKEGT